MISGLNHITLAVSDLERSLKFYIDTLGFTGHVKWDNGAYISIGGTWFCLSCDSPCPKTDYTHIAFDISREDFEHFSSRVISSDIEVWKQNISEGQSLYLLDPDGHKLEIHVGSLKSRLEALKIKPYSGLVWL
ncbi:fosfomycin resistance glutathione transferase [Vibrio parahaemolyticus]|uniref:fosfomycin resistance glutathione transferase n=1 Tax=Vibrio parahaemolyticus TaxID=670 RepID=UPI0004719DEC|nr:fosfomycin resistance glutathione transferase [Vibrio parahaemolyticus]EGQ8735149.1 fosfomycin resistance glutathione transferase [Vibrio parahaemolyticus]EGQ8886969.1 fosfomycin resistance glutathione transferase [Vibrio parahaemolyticus]EGQ8917792.1 fosfomycin resistance glutathione transferase [Vibrio parahaemolyticus]EGQ8936218.1 fosfomycin resistance glutathione transferase [Vibrio parahaemolyticus]EGR3280078.1 fosfomycin resistance glutathione transferase [Vibrio parahaemolyticus]